MAIVWSEKQRSTSNIWTGIANFISSDDNSYTEYFYCMCLHSKINKGASEILIT